MGRSGTTQISGSKNLGNLKLLWELPETGPITICCDFRGFMNYLMPIWERQEASFQVEIHSQQFMQFTCPTVLPSQPSLHPSRSIYPSSSPSSYPYALIYSTISVFIHHPTPSSFYCSIHPSIILLVLVYPASPLLHLSLCICLLNHTSHSHNHLLIHQDNHPLCHVNHHL